MDESDAAGPFPPSVAIPTTPSVVGTLGHSALPEASLAPSAPLGSGPADPPMSPAPMRERADEAGPAAPAADLEPTAALASDQIRPEPNPATTLPPLAPARADACEDLSQPRFA